MNLTFHFLLVPRLRMMELHHYSPICLHDLHRNILCLCAKYVVKLHVCTYEVFILGWTCEHTLLRSSTWMFNMLRQYITVEHTAECWPMYTQLRCIQNFLLTLKRKCWDAKNLIIIFLILCIIVCFVGTRCNYL
jgi:hypothetical protein